MQTNLRARNLLLELIKQLLLVPESQITDRKSWMHYSYNELSNGENVTLANIGLSCAMFLGSLFIFWKSFVLILFFRWCPKVDSGGCFSGDATSALVLKGVNLTLHSGEVMAILGSKGSGKRALLDVIAKRADGRGRGSVLLNGAPLTKNLFQQRCAYVTHQVDFIPGLTVSQTLHYTPTILSGYMKTSKVRQILADLALSQVSNKKVENLNISERRRLAVGIQLVRDPVMLLLDEPTQDLDPLSAYLLISILSNTAKKTGCGILLSLEKPRSDVFPFLDRWV